MSQTQSLKPKIWKSGDEVQPEVLFEASALLRQGGLMIYPTETAWCMAKSRTLAEEIELTQFDTTLWTRLLADQAK